MSTHTLENYDIAFSADPENPNGPEVALLVIEKQDIPPFEGRPHKAFLVQGSSERGTSDLRRLRVLIQERAGPPRNPDAEIFCLVMDLPLAVYEMLSPMKKIWICEVDEGKVISENKINLYSEKD